MSMELILNPALVEVTQGIKNKEALKVELSSHLDYYRNLAVTEETMKDAKSDRATLNKLRTAIDNQRKSVKKQFTDLYAPFEADCNELIAMIDEPIGAIDSQMEVLNDKRKAEKYAELEKHFTLLQPPAFVKIESVLDPKWGNATAKLDKLKADLAERVQKIVDDNDAIRELYADSPMLTAIIERFEQTLDKGAALAYAAEIERKEKAEQERKAQERKETPAQPPIEPTPDNDTPEPQKPTESATIAPQGEPVGRVTFTVTGTKAQIIAVRDFMKQNGIKFDVVK